MEKTETPAEFYTLHKVEDPPVSLITHPEKESFNVYRRDDFPCNIIPSHNRRDFYKISLICGTGILHYADRNIEIDRDALIFSNPNVPHSWEINPKEQPGYFCVFREDFFSLRNRHEVLKDSALFKIGGNPVAFPDDVQLAHIDSIFRIMLSEMETDYAHKYDLQHNYVMLLIHEAQKMQAANRYVRHGNASARILSLFLDLLERQFPIDSPLQVFKLGTARDYAARLGIHVNHLNRAVKESSGKTTTEHIAARVVKEATALLKHTDWSVAEIAASLGFEYPAYFNNFFKKQTGLTPGSMR